MKELKTKTFTHEKSYTRSLLMDFPCRCRPRGQLIDAHSDNEHIAFHVLRVNEVINWTSHLIVRFFCNLYTLCEILLQCICIKTLLICRNT